MNSIWLAVGVGPTKNWLNKSLAVALALLHLANLRKTSTVVFTRRVQSLFSISPDAGYDALTRLTEARLIRASRARGRPPEVTLLDLKGQAMVMWLDEQ
jgi:hypothetical protein